MKRSLSLYCSQLVIVILVFLRPACSQVSEYDRMLAVRNRIFDQLPTDVASLKEPRYARLVLRFYKPDCELVLVIYFHWKSELVSYTWEGLGDQTLSQRIWDSLHTHPQMKDEEILNGVHVKTSRSFVDSPKVEQLVAELKKIKMSPFLDPEIALDEYLDYDYWFESGGESVHYTVHGVFQKRPADDLVRWMIKLRDTFK